MIRKILAVLIVALLIPFAFAGCGGEKSAVPDSVSNTAADSGAESVASQTVEKSEEPVKEEKKAEEEKLEKGIGKGNLAPDISFYTLDGKKVELSDFRGKVVMLNFWATWCGNCRSEMSSMEVLYGKYKDEGFVILAVDFGESGKKVQKFIEQRGYTFPVLLDTQKISEKTFDILYLPTTFIIDKKGVISEVVIGARDWGSDYYSQLIAELLSE